MKPIEGSAAQPVADQVVPSGAAREDIAILVVSWDGYQRLWPAFFHSFFKYWPDCPYPIVLGSNTKTYADNRVTPLLIGEDKRFSSNLEAMLSKIQQEWVVVWLDDVLLSARVDTDHIGRLLAGARSMGVAHLQLLVRRYDPMPQLCDVWLTPEIKEIPSQLPYRVSLNLGLWRRSCLQSLLRSGENAQECECLGSIRSMSVVQRFCCLSGKPLKGPPFSIVHGIFQRQWTREAAAFLQKEGFPPDTRWHPVQSYWSHVCLNIYVVLRYLSYIVVYRLGGASGLLAMAATRRWRF